MIKARETCFAGIAFTGSLTTLRLPRMLSVAGLLLLFASVAYAGDPCGSAIPRALVLGGGGVKGAFEAGAVYHLVAHRHCDFTEFSGVSVGALNATFLAQAEPATDTKDSYANLLDQSEALVSLWQSLKSTNDFARSRPLATLRFGLLGLDSLVDFTPLRRLEDKSITLDRLSAGRPVRVGVVSFYDGEYQEVLAKPMLSGGTTENFKGYLIASSTPPVYGRMPGLPERSATPGVQQFADGGLRHMTPVDSYFAACPPPTLLPKNLLTTVADGRQLGNCPARDRSVPEHEPIQQLFVIATSPYNRDSDASPVLDPKCCASGTRQITDGRKILGRTLALMDDEVYRRDLDSFLSANDVLAWRWRLYQQLILGASPEQAAEVKQHFRAAPSFAFESYNRDPEDPDAPSRPYEIGLVVPEKEFADLKALLTLSPEGVQVQLYCGCVAADQMMQTNFGLPSMVNQCAERFPARTRPVTESSSRPPSFEPSLCEGKPKPQSNPTLLATGQGTNSTLDTLDSGIVGSREQTPRTNPGATTVGTGQDRSVSAPPRTQ